MESYALKFPSHLGEVVGTSSGGTFDFNKYRKHVLTYWNHGKNSKGMYSCWVNREENGILKDSRQEREKRGTECREDK